MGAITLGGREWSTNVTWIPAAMTTVVCGGLVIAAADWLNVEGFPIHLLHEPTAVGGGYTPHPPPIEAEGYGGETIPGMEVVFMGEPVSDAAKERFLEIIRNNQLTPEHGGFSVVVLKPEIAAEVSRMHDALHNGVPYEEVQKSVSPEGVKQFEILRNYYNSGVNLIATDTSLSFGIIQYPGERLNYFNLGTFH